MNPITYMELRKTSSDDPISRSRTSTAYLAKLTDGTTREITELTFGRNFVLATLENGASKAFILHQGIVSLAACSNQQQSQFSRTQKTLGEILFQFQFPFTARYWYQRDPGKVHSDIVKSTTRGFLVLEQQSTLIPLANLGYLELQV